MRWHDFLYEQIGTIKDFYSDSFDRKLKVTIK